MAPYIRNIVRRSTRPHRGTWLIWTVLAVIVSLSQHADRGSWSLGMAAVRAATNGVVPAGGEGLRGGRGPDRGRHDGARDVADLRLLRAECGRRRTSCRAGA